MSPDVLNDRSSCTRSVKLNHENKGNMSLRNVGATRTVTKPRATEDLLIEFCTYRSLTRDTEEPAWNLRQSHSRTCDATEPCRRAY